MSNPSDVVEVDGYGMELEGYPFGGELEGKGVVFIDEGEERRRGFRASMSCTKSLKSSSSVRVATAANFSL